MRVVPREGSLYPHLPKGSRTLVRVPANELTTWDRTLVVLSSLAFVGSVAWVPIAYAWAWKRWKRIPKEHKRRRMLYATFLMALPAVAAVGPHRSPKFGHWLEARRWHLWRAWLRFVAYSVVADAPNSNFNIRDDQAIFAVIPHGLFPFALAFSALPEQAADAFGHFRPVVATATSLFPFVKTFLSWIRSVDANREAVDRALAHGDRIGLAPGGIAEMFEGYPKPGTHPDEEYAILQSRKGFVRLAVKHGLPVVPVFCFGATKMLRRLQLPAFFETLSKALRISICIFFGAWGFPVPFRQKLTYVMGNPIWPDANSSQAFDDQVDVMHSEFCAELTNLFERYKESYGWDHKTLKLV